MLLGHPGKVVQNLEIDIDRFGDARFLDFDGDLFAGKELCDMHLPDRRGRQRRVVELGEQLGDRFAEFCFDDFPDFRDRHGRHLIRSFASSSR